MADPAHTTAGPSGRQERLSASAKHAILRGLRHRANEWQVTQTLAALAESDPTFARAFVRLVLRVAGENSRHEANVRLMGEPPEDLTCRAEESIYDQYDLGLGRIDLRFDGVDFTLFVENKLHSGFGYEQLERYQAALENLPEDRTHAGLIAITRDVPGYGELDAGAKGWLGAIRWARLYDENLGGLPVSDPDVATQWKLLVDILHDQGDLGMTSVKSGLIIAWSRYEEGREHLVDIVDDVKQRALDMLRAALAARRRGAGDAEELADMHFFGHREAVPVKRRMMSVSTAFRVPSSISRPTVALNFWAADSGQPIFSVEVRPWKAQERLEDNDRQLLGCARKLAQAGFQTADEGSEHVWWTEHPPEEYLDYADVPTRLLELIEYDVNSLVASGVFAYDFEAAERGGRGGPPKVRPGRAR
jgi:hypothetical protein